MASNAQAIYVLGIAGTGTGALAGLLQAAGHRVSGVDSQAYPPMGDKLAEWGIPVAIGFDAAHLATPPDLVIVGNVIRRDNVEATYVREHNLPAMSMPEAIATFAIGERHSVVVAGTHGKTTTTALIAHLLRHAECDPGFLVGGALVGERDSFRLGSGPFVIEGDEYDTAYFDKGPKFLHYRAKTLVITSLEFDHADIYADVAAIEAAFAKLIAGMAEGGLVIVWRGATRACALLAQHGQHLEVWQYGTSVAARISGLEAAPMLEATAVQTGADGLTMTLSTREGHGRRALPTPPSQVSVPLWGHFGADNALAATLVALHHNVAPTTIAAGLSTFRGVRRRLEVRGTVDGVTIVDDFAHHPTAVAATLQAARERFAGRRLWAIFEPRSATSRRDLFFAEYLAAFSHADVAVIAHHERLSEVPLERRFRPGALADALAQAGTISCAPADHAALLDYIAAHARAGDVLLVLSNGDFNGLVGQLLRPAKQQQGADGPH